MPTGRLSSLNTKGLHHYKQVLQMLTLANIEPWVTLYHFDLPSTLEIEENGWLNKTMISYFEAYAKICFQHFNRYVKHWITINEAHTIATAGYLYGNAAPGRCSNRSFCAFGNGTTEPYIVGHNLLNAHARAVQQYRALGDVGGDITMVISGDWTEPWNVSNPLDVVASQRRQEYQIGWFADPIFFGKYPDSMTKHGVGGKRLPIFTAEESALLRGSADYFALNHYTSRYGQHATQPSSCLNTGGANVAGGEGWDEDQCCSALTMNSKGTVIGLKAEGSDWLYSVPWGFRKLLVWLNTRYGNVVPKRRMSIVVTENGCVDPRSSTSSTSTLNDTFRVQYHSEYLSALRQAKFVDKVPVDGYFVWSLLDNVEWGDGFLDTFGLYYVERPSLLRIAKESVLWLSKYIESWTE